MKDAVEALDAAGVREGVAEGGRMQLDRLQRVRDGLAALADALGAPGAPPGGAASLVQPWAQEYFIAAEWAPSAGGRLHLHMSVVYMGRSKIRELRQRVQALVLMTGARGGGDGAAVRARD